MTWRSSDCVDEATRAELAEIEEDVAEIEESSGVNSVLAPEACGARWVPERAGEPVPVRRVTQAYASCLLEQVEGLNPA